MRVSGLGCSQGFEFGFWGVGRVLGFILFWGVIRVVGFGVEGVIRVLVFWVLAFGMQLGF